MVKNPSEPDENQTGEIKSEKKQTARESAFERRAASRFSATDETENLLEIPEREVAVPNDSINAQTNWQTANDESPFELEIEDVRTPNRGETLLQTAVQPESVGETTRKSGLAYAAAITLFGSIVFMLALGWLADWLLGTAPWGIVCGIVLGAVIGFFQFFRITSQIFKNKD